MTGRVVVIGAGLAGLATAVALERHGVEVVVVEARDSVGGRVRTWRSGGRGADLGGERVDGDHTRVLALADRSAVPLIPVGKGTAGLDDLLVLDGVARKVTEGDGGAIDAEVDRVVSHLSELAAQLPRLDDPTTHPEADRLDARSVGDLFDELVPAADARRILEHKLRAEAAVEPDHLSLLAWVHDVAVAEAKPSEQVESHRLSGGAHRLAEALCRQLSVPVRVGTPARTVELLSDKASVTTDQGPLDADAVVLAVPPPVVRQLSFVGEVPSVIDRLSQLPMGDVTKRLLMFDTPVWRETGCSGNALIEPAGFTTWEARTPEVLIAYAGGRAARRLATMPLAELHAALPPTWRSNRPPDDVHTMHWAGEIETGGAWCAPAPGQVRANWHALRQPHGRLHLAGEHTAARYGGFMEGALESAERVAAELIG